MKSNVSKADREFAEVIAASENARFEKCDRAVSAYITESELQILRDLAERLGASQSETIRRAVRLYGILCGYEGTGGTIECRPREGALFGSKNLKLSSGGIERR